MNKFMIKKGMTTKVWLNNHSEEERRIFGANLSYPFGFREFAYSTALLVKAVVYDYCLFLASCRMKQTRRNAVAEILGDRF